MEEMLDEPAFPVYDHVEHEVTYGMTLRDYFAAKAMQGVMACNGVYDDEKKLARWCYEQADAMLKARQE